MLALIYNYEVVYGGSSIIANYGNWIEIGNLEINWNFKLDIITVSMFLPVLIISFLVQLYSSSYMNDDPSKCRFFSYLSLFSFFMLILITGDNFILLFIGWEGVGLASYLLINFWFQRLNANFAALKAFLMNRIGDWALILGI